MSRIGLHYPGGLYYPGGRDWQFRAPRLLEAVLTIAHLGRDRGNRASNWIYLKWPVEPRKPGTIG
jgi:hypothetical protein